MLDTLHDAQLENDQPERVDLGLGSVVVLRLDFVLVHEEVFLGREEELLGHDFCDSFFLISDIKSNFKIAVSVHKNVFVRHSVVVVHLVLAEGVGSHSLVQQISDSLLTESLVRVSVLVEQSSEADFWELEVHHQEVLSHAEKGLLFDGVVDQVQEVLISVILQKVDVLQNEPQFSFRLEPLGHF